MGKEPRQFDIIAGNRSDFSQTYVITDIRVHVFRYLKLLNVIVSTCFDLAFPLLKKIMKIRVKYNCLFLEYHRGGLFLHVDSSC